MKIVFVLPSIGIGGGTRVVFKHASMLRNKGHIVWIVFPQFPPIYIDDINTLRKIKYYIKKVIYNSSIQNSIDLFGEDINVTKIPYLHNRCFPNADVVIATQWSTAKIVNCLDQSKGVKFYFIQGYETFTGPIDLVESTYSLSLNKIVVATWLKSIIKDKYNQESSVVMNGVDTNLFFNDTSSNKDRNRKRVLMLYHSNPIKGIQDGISAFLLARKHSPNIDLVMFGVWKGNDVPEWVEFHVNPSQEQIRMLYCSSDVFVCPSKVEGFALPPMEAMACKVPTVLTNVGAISEYSIAGTTALLSEPGDVESLSRNIVKIVTNTTFAEEIGNSGYEHIKKYNWDNSNNEFENILLNSLAQNL